MNIVYKEIPGSSRKEFVELLEELHEYHYSQRPDIFNQKIDNIDEVVDFMLKNYNIFVAALKNEDGSESLVGFIAFDVINKPLDSFTQTRSRIVVHDLIVTQKMRSNGIGKYLLGLVKNYANTNNINLIEIGVWGFNSIAMNFYGKQGFYIKTANLECKLN